MKDSRMGKVCFKRNNPFLNVWIPIGGFHSAPSFQELWQLQELKIVTVRRKGV